MIQQLSEWTQGLHDPILWLDGPAVEMDDMEKALTSLAAKFIDLVGANSLPVLSYFCELPRAVQENVTRETKATIALLYALLRQIVELLPPQFDTTLDFSEGRFLGLNGALDS